MLYKFSYTLHVCLQKVVLVVRDGLLSYFFFDSVQLPFQDYFTHIETSQSVGEAKREYPRKPPDTPASRTWLVSHVASAGLEPTPVTAVR